MCYFARLVGGPDVSGRWRIKTEVKLERHNLKEKLKGHFGAMFRGGAE